MPARPVVPRARLALMLGGLAMFGPFAIDTMFPAFPAIERDFAVSALAMQQTISAYLVAYALMSIFHGPVSDARGRKPVILVGQVVVVTVPANDVCLSSGFGMRGSRMHEGIDLTSRPAGMIYTAAPGRVIEARESSGYGLQVLIDHGHGVYTRYAHLEYFDAGIQLGSSIGFGQPVGMMGATGNAEAVHLHFELLTGNYDNPRASKGLTPNDPFAFPAYNFLGY